MSETGKTRFKSFAVGFGFILAVLLCASAELGFGYLNKHSSRRSVRIAAEEPRLGYSNRDILGETATRRGIFPAMPPVEPDWNYEAIPPKDGTSYKSYYGEGGGSGYALWKDLPFPMLMHTSRSELMHGSEKIYDVTYTMDSFARRVVPGEDRKKVKDFLIVAGCSYAFGEGLPDDQTLEADIARKTPETRIYNYAGLGFSTGEAWLRLKAIDPSEITEKTGTVIYLFMDNHPARTLGAMSVVGVWGPHKTHFFLDAKGEVQTDGPFFKAQPIRTRLYSGLAKSEILKYFGIDIPGHYGPQDWELMTRMVRNMKTEAERLGAKRFYVVFYPGEARYSTQWIPYLEREGVSYIDYGHWSLAALTKNRSVIPYDGHPSAESDRILADSLVQELGLK